MTYSEQEAVLNTLVKAFVSRNEATRQQAIQDAIGKLHHDDRLRLMEKLLDYFDVWTVWEGPLNLALAVLTLLLCSAVIPPVGIGFTIGCFASIFSLAYALSFKRASRAKEALLTLLESEAYVELIPYCLNMKHYRINDESTAKYRRKQFRGEILKRTLPFLQPHDTLVWTQMQKDHLISTLHSPFSDVELILSVLGALEKIGQQSALKQVRLLAQMPKTYLMNTIANVPITKIPEIMEKSKRIQKRAKEVLPAIEARAQEEQNPRTLLRAAETPYYAPANQLLRAAGSQPDTTPASELLRPHNIEANPQRVSHEMDLFRMTAEDEELQKVRIRGYGNSSEST